MYQFLWTFFVYAFLGWCTEVSFAALKTGKFVNRGFLNGPVCPIYGLGVVIVLACLTPLKKNFPLLFLGSVVLTSLLEGVTGLVLEKLFHQRWWDYSDEPFNFGGYICLRFSIAWGLACLFVVDIIHPTIEFLMGIIPHPLGWVLLGLSGASMAVDLAATVYTILNINRRLRQIDELAGKIREASDGFGENLADKVLDAVEKGVDMKENLDSWMEEMAQRRDELETGLEEWKDSLAQRSEHPASSIRADLAQWKDKLQELLDGNIFGLRRLLAAFPQMRSTDHKQALERLRRRMELSRKRDGK